MEYSDIEDEFYDCESELEENKIELLDSENSDNEVINEEDIQERYSRFQESSERKFFNTLGLHKRRHAQVLTSSEDENENIL